MDEIAAAERDVSEGKSSRTSFVLVAQQSLFDENTRTARSAHALVYCHVPFDCKLDVSDQIEFQLETIRTRLSRLHSRRHKMVRLILRDQIPI